MRPVILASSSPRRRELLALGGVVFRVRATATPEVAQPGEAAEALALRLSQAKARAAATDPGTPADAIVIGADTIVVLTDEAEGETILGKPRDAAEATHMLRQLRGRTHRVLTAVTLIDTERRSEVSDLVAARVPMREYSEAEIAAYVAGGDPLDKAGAYAIQYPGFQPVDLPNFRDCFATVMGLPVCRVLARLRDLGLPPPPLYSAAPSGQTPADCAYAYDGPACPIVNQLEAARRR